MVAHDCFISHSSDDKATADAACAMLEASGVRCWIAPRDVRPGFDYSEQLLDGIDGSKVLVLIFSASSNGSTHVRREVERAVSKGLAVLPLRIEEITPSKSLEFLISSTHWLDAITPPIEEHLSRLVDAARVLIDADDSVDSTSASKSRPIIKGGTASDSALDDAFLTGWYLRNVVPMLPLPSTGAKEREAFDEALSCICRFSERYLADEKYLQRLEALREDVKSGTLFQVGDVAQNRAKFESIHELTLEVEGELIKSTSGRSAQWYQLGRALGQLHAFLLVDDIGTVEQQIRSNIEAATFLVNELQLPKFLSLEVASFTQLFEGSPNVTEIEKAGGQVVLALVQFLKMRTS